MTCNNKCIHYPICEQRKFDFANIDECPHYLDLSNREAIKYLIVPVATSTMPSAEYLVQKRAYDLAIKALEERPHAEWVNTSIYDTDGECSYCCYVSKKYYNFCPNCGADMRKENK